jgi:hypothetical protein
MSVRKEETSTVSVPVFSYSPHEPNMSFETGSAWLHEFFRREDAFAVGDDLGTCWCSCGVVILEGIGYRDRLTSLPSQASPLTLSPLLQQYLGDENE